MFVRGLAGLGLRGGNEGSSSALDWTVLIRGGAAVALDKKSLPELLPFFLLCSGAGLC